MKITISIPQKVYDELEGLRGRVPRSTYIQGLIQGEGNAKKRVVLEHGFDSDVSYSDSEPIESTSMAAVAGFGSMGKKKVVKGSKELPSQEAGEFKTYFKK